MKVFVNAVLVLAVVALGNANSVRQYNALNNKRFAVIPDEDGKLHYVNLEQIPRFEPVNSNNVTLFLYTPLNKAEPLEFKPHEFDKLLDFPNYDPSLPNFFTTHGWTGSAHSASVNQAKDALLSLHDVNVFCVDWSGPSHQFYTIARMQIKTIGKIVGEFINQMMAEFNLRPYAFGLMGHSLGGQLVGLIGHAVNGKIAFIVGLDPAAPMFVDEPIEERLDQSDAEFVQVVHTNSGFLGYPDSIGHADFHPNGGVKQPDCGPDIIGTCSHFIVKDFVPESILTNAFTGVHCESYEEFEAGNCANNERSYFGGWPIDTSARGDFYLNTNGAPPFALGDI